MSARGREAAAVAASKTVDVAQVVVCGVDSSDESIEAVRQSAVLAGPRGRLVLVSVINSGMAAPAGFAVTTSPAELERAARRDLERVRVAVADRCPTEERIVEGLPVPALRAQAAEIHATLIACGVHGRSRLLGAVRGSVATALLHASACSVLAARQPADPARFPRSILVGVDGAASSNAALAAGRALASRLDAEIGALFALGEPGGDLDAARAAAAYLDVLLLEDNRGAVAALTATDADLVVVGARGIQGIRAFRSVSERVAHRADSSVLVVR